MTNDFGYNARTELIEALMGADRYSYRYDPIGNRVVATNVYDQMSRRVAKASPLGVRFFLYDGWNPLQEVTLGIGGISTNLYVWGPDLSGTLQGAGGVGGLLAALRDGTPFFASYDANGNVTEYVSTNGTVVAHFEYDPFGNTIAATGALADAFAYRFSTKYWDSETAHYYYGHRFYNPSLGRWVSRDPLGEEGGGNLSAFANNNGVASIDPIGLDPVQDPRLVQCDGHPVGTIRASRRYELCPLCIPSNQPDYGRTMGERMLGRRIITTYSVCVAVPVPVLRLRLGRWFDGVWRWLRDEAGECEELPRGRMAA